MDFYWRRRAMNAELGLGGDRWGQSLTIMTMMRRMHSGECDHGEVGDYEDDDFGYFDAEAAFWIV